MDFLIADTFTDSLGRLTGDEQKAVKTTAFDLQLNPAGAGMSFHRVEKTKDKNFWSVRVSSDNHQQFDERKSAPSVHGAIDRSSGNLLQGISVSSCNPKLVLRITACVRLPPVAVVFSMSSSVPLLAAIPPACLNLLSIHQWNIIRWGII